MKQVTRSICRAIALSGTSMRTFRSFIRIQRKRDIEILALGVREVRRERRVSEMIERAIEPPVQARPLIRHRNSVNGPVGAVPVDQDFVAHLRQTATRDAIALNKKILWSLSFSLHFR